MSGGGNSSRLIVDGARFKAEAMAAALNSNFN
jgi:hypothetical protein